MEKQKKLWLLVVGGFAILVAILIGYNSNSNLFQGLTCRGRNCPTSAPASQPGSAPASTPVSTSESTDFAVKSIDVSFIEAGYNENYNTDYVRFTVNFDNKAPAGTMVDWATYVSDADGNMVDNTPYLGQQTLTASTSYYSFEVIKERVCNSNNKGSVNATLDPQNKVAEIDEGNNVIFKDFNCQ